MCCTSTSSGYVISMAGHRRNDVVAMAGAAHGAVGPADVVWTHHRNYATKKGGDDNNTPKGGKTPTVCSTLLPLSHPTTHSPHPLPSPLANPKPCRPGHPPPPPTRIVLPWSLWMPTTSHLRVPIAYSVRIPLLVPCRVVRSYSSSCLVG